ncbi:UNKNOWN [Stylonychia lemnae]|uniref:Uncharacterized protein n=1 Tax=Stylonychia lemnae TaxID=5949 RepID=A0A078A498_STYLE|nr:UNKNOWN [Stylonychia lemnae]|eukprot:CDW76318.1 UNKNOWN [Stylonychia lemnae]
MLNSYRCNSDCLIQEGYYCKQILGQSTKCSRNCDSANLQTCRDRNKVSGDGCDESCQVEIGYVCFDSENGEFTCKSSAQSINKEKKVEFCGNNILEMGEECDDGNQINDDGCDSACLIENSYTLILQSQNSRILQNSCLFEGRCLDSNFQSKDGCDSDCKTEKGYYCISDQKSGVFQCFKRTQTMDDSTSRFLNMDSVQCKKDSSRSIDEECDDGNMLHNGGCNEQCKIQDGYMCTTNLGQESKCFRRCGIMGQKCFDHNNENKDGCDSFCFVEEGFSCFSYKNEHEEYDMRCRKQQSKPSTLESLTKDIITHRNLEKVVDHQNSRRELESSAGRGLSTASNLCNNGVIDFGEECDDGGGFFSQICNTNCGLWYGAAAYIVELGQKSTEYLQPMYNGAGQCLDNNNYPYDGIDAKCKVHQDYFCFVSLISSVYVPQCYNGYSYKQALPTQSPAPATTQSASNPNCNKDGVLTLSEECDDQDTTNNGGQHISLNQFSSRCDSNCRVKYGWTCVNQLGSYSLCYQSCLEVGYRCLDRNYENNDGVEPGYRCMATRVSLTEWDANSFKCDPTKAAATTEASTTTILATTTEDHYISSINHN